MSSGPWCPGLCPLRLFHDYAGYLLGVEINQLGQNALGGVTPSPGWFLALGHKREIRRGMVHKIRKGIDINAAFRVTGRLEVARALLRYAPLWPCPPRHLRARPPPFHAERSQTRATGQPKTNSKSSMSASPSRGQAAAQARGAASTVQGASILAPGPAVQRALASGSKASPACADGGPSVGQGNRPRSLSA